MLIFDLKIRFLDKSSIEISKLCRGRNRENRQWKDLRGVEGYLLCFAMFCYGFAMFSQCFPYVLLNFATFCYVFDMFGYILRCFAMVSYVLLHFAMLLLCFCYVLAMFCDVFQCFAMFCNVLRCFCCVFTCFLMFRRNGSAGTPSSDDGTKSSLAGGGSVSTCVWANKNIAKT